MVNGSRFGAVRNFVRTFASDKTPMWLTLVVALLPVLLAFYQFDSSRKDAVLSALIQRAGTTAAEFLPALDEFNNSVMDQYEFDTEGPIKGKSALLKNLTTQYSVMGDIVPFLDRADQRDVRQYMSTLVEFKVRVENAQGFDDLKPLFEGMVDISSQRDKVLSILFEAIGGKTLAGAQNI